MRARANLTVIAYYLAVHALAVAAFVLPVRPLYVVLAVLLYAAASLGTTVGLHRLISHRSFKCPLAVEYALVSAAMLTGQGSPLLWAATHRKHHADPDGPEDVHSPRVSFWHSHMGWIIDDGSTDPDAWRSLCSDLKPHAYYHWLLRWRMAPQAFAVALIGLTLGWVAVPFVLFLPIAVWMHLTYSVNSVCHVPRFGRRSHETRDDSRNVWWVATLMMGEGWHNNHHAFPRSADFGLEPGQLDLGGMVIRGLQAVGLAWDVHQAPPSLERRRA
jgi:stearoyl-CoA desaturase (delta-9 desaturase)